MRGSIGGLKTSAFQPCHIICQLGSGLDSVDGVKAMFLEPTFRALRKSSGKGALATCTKGNSVAKHGSGHHDQNNELLEIKLGTHFTCCWYILTLMQLVKFIGNLGLLVHLLSYTDYPTY